MSYILRLHQFYYVKADYLHEMPGEDNGPLRLLHQRDVSSPGEKGGSLGGSRLEELRPYRPQLLQVPDLVLARLRLRLRKPLLDQMRRRPAERGRAQAVGVRIV